MNITTLFLILSIFFNFLIILFFSRIKLFRFNLDKPDNIRKIHSKPTPLAGGVILFLNIFIYYFFTIYFNNFFLNEIFFVNIKTLNIFFLILLSIFFLGFFDDKFNLNANLKFFILILIIFSLLKLDQSVLINEINFSFYSKNISLDNYNFIFTIFCFLVFMNAFNMFDGINLQSTLYSLFIFLSILFFYADSILIKLLIIFLICFSYLNYNEKSFLGDSGTLLLGFIISYSFIKLHNLNFIKYADDIVIFMLIPGIDLIRLFITRLLKKRSPLSSDRLHLHHYLIKYFSLTQTILIISALIITPIILSKININNIYVIIVTLITYLGLLFWLNNKNNNHFG